MKNVFENEFVKMNFDDANNFMKTVWTTKITMEREEYRGTIKSFLEQLQIYHPTKLLIDYVNSGYVVVPEDQDWINEHIYPRIAEAGIKKLAFLVGTDFSMNMSHEQMVEDSQKNVGEQLEQGFFEDYQQALDWLNQSNS